MLLAETRYYTIITTTTTTTTTKANNFPEFERGHEIAPASSTKNSSRKPQLSIIFA
jgi:hypothetical protein